MKAPKNMTDDEREVVAFVHSARAGDDIAWTRLVRRFDRMLRSVARSYRLAPSDVDDVVQATWLRLFKHIDQVRDPAAIAGWLAKTARREALRVLQAPVREHLTDDPYAGQPSMAETPESDLLDSELRAALARALASLPNRQRRLMTLLAIQLLRLRVDQRNPGDAVGSIGPTRAPALRLHTTGAPDLRPSAG